MKKNLISKYLGEGKETTILKKGMFSITRSSEDKEGSAIRIYKGKKLVGSGDYDRGAGAFFVKFDKSPGQKSYNSLDDLMAVAQGAPPKPQPRLGQDPRSRDAKAFGEPDPEDIEEYERDLKQFKKEMKELIAWEKKYGDVKNIPKTYTMFDSKKKKYVKVKI